MVVIDGLDWLAGRLCGDLCPFRYFLSLDILLLFQGAHEFLLELCRYRHEAGHVFILQLSLELLPAILELLDLIDRILISGLELLELHFYIALPLRFGLFILECLEHSPCCVILHPCFGSPMLSHSSSKPDYAAGPFVPR
jgi:hypothetical protein